MYGFKSEMYIRTNLYLQNMEIWKDPSIFRFFCDVCTFWIFEVFRGFFTAMISQEIFYAFFLS